jgi:hypothetical protein
MIIKILYQEDIYQILEVMFKKVLVLLLNKNLKISFNNILMITNVLVTMMIILYKAR